MEIIDPKQKQEFEERRLTSNSGIQSDSSGRVLAGLILLAIGAMLIARKMGFYFPDWLFSWEMLLIAIGSFIGAKNNFRLGGWLVPIFIGVLFLFEELIPDLNLRPYFWPIILILIGGIMIATAGKKKRWNSERRSRGWASGKITQSNEELMESVAVFGGIKKNVISKNFRGGEAVTIFGGTEINLSQADLEGQIELEIVQIFGGTKIILPPHWVVKSEMVSIFGGIEDKRVVQKDTADFNKTLVLKGVSIMGSIDIRSF